MLAIPNANKIDTNSMKSTWLMPTKASGTGMNSRGQSGQHRVYMYRQGIGYSICTLNFAASYFWISGYSFCIVME